MQFWTNEIEKQVGDRVQIVLSDPQLLQAYQLFGADVLRRSSVFHGLDRFLRTQKVRGKLCFEIGTWNALTAVVLSRYFDKVVTVDVAHLAQKHQVLRALGIANVECIDIADNEHKAEVAKELAFDFAYIDGNHADDTESDFELCRKGGRVLFHEAWPWQPPVWLLVNRLPPAQVSWNGCGLALWDRGRA